MLPGDRTGSAGRGRGADDAIICYARGTMILTPGGERRIETLARGDMVLTLDDGPQPIRWIGARSVRATGALAPVRFARGALGNTRDLLVSPQHRMLVKGGRHAGDEVLVPASALIDDYRVSVAYGGIVGYHHMLFDRHQVVIANGAASESFHPGGAALATLDAREREGLFGVMPDLRSDAAGYGDFSRPYVAANDLAELRFG